MVNTINVKMEALEATFRVQSASWMDASNLVLIVPTPNDTQNGSWIRTMVLQLTNEGFPHPTQL